KRRLSRRCANLGTLCAVRTRSAGEVRRVPMLRRPSRRPADGVIVLDGEAIEYRVVRSARRRRTIEIAVEADTVIVRAPMSATDEEIRDLLRQRANWIRRHQTEAPPAFRCETGSTIPYRGA